MNKNYIKFLVIHAIILVCGTALNNCCSMDEINPLSDTNVNQTNLKSKDKKDYKIESISEKQRNFSEVKEIIKSFSDIYEESDNPEIK